MSLVKSLSVGNGDMFYIKHGSDNFSIIDCCMDDSNEVRIVNELKRESKNKGITRFISTHPDDDHIRGLDYLDSQMSIMNFYCVKNKATKDDETTDFEKYCELRDSDKKSFYIKKGCTRKWMNQETFFENFELLADAPNGVQKLRELILNMAIQGKLLPQNLDDKSVYVLLEEIKSEKNQLIQKRKLKLRKISESDDIKILKYKIPSNWCWFILPEVVFFQEGPGIRNWQFKSHGIKLLNVQNILPNSKVFFENSDKYVSEEEVNENNAHFLIEDGDYLLALEQSYVQISFSL